MKIEQKHEEMSRTCMGRKSVWVISSQAEAWRNEERCIWRTMIGQSGVRGEDAGTSRDIVPR